MGDAARALGTPVVSGNVSFYNETSGRAVYPTPTIAMVGLLEDHRRYAVAHFQREGAPIVLLGNCREELGGSEWLAQRRGIEAGHPPSVDLEHEARLADLLVAAVAEGCVSTAHDVADGGLAIALAECCMSGDTQIGARVELADSIRLEALLFGESTGRVLGSGDDLDTLLVLAEAHGIPARRIGETGGRRLVVAPGAGPAWIDVEVDELAKQWKRAIPARLEEDT